MKPVDATFTLESNEWQGVVEPRLVLRSAVPCSPPPIAVLGEGGEYLERAFARVDAAPADEHPPVPPAPCGVIADRRGHGIAAQITQLVAAGGGLLVLCADAPARHRHLAGRLGGFSLASYDALERGAAGAHGHRHVLLLDPPAGDAQHALAVGSAPGSRTVMAWGPAELRFAEHIHEREYGLRDPLAACYRTLRDRGGAAGQDLEAALRGDGPQQRSPELAGRLLRVLAEIGLIELDLERAVVTVTERRRVSLESSPAYREYDRRRLDGLTSLRASIRQAA